MKLYLLKQDDNNNYDTYDSCVVCADSEEEAINIHPNGNPFVEAGTYGTWARSKSSITCKEIGESAPNVEKGVVLASFNAG